MIIHEFDLDIVPNGEKREIWLSQYDEDFILKINLYARNGVFTIPTGTTVAIRGTKPDGNGFSADGSLNNNVVTVIGNQQMTAVAGRAVFEITLYNSNEKELSSMNFSLLIERAPLDKDTITSDSVIRELIDVTDRADEIVAAAETIEDAAAIVVDSEAYAVGKRSGIDVIPGDVAYHNNSKYYSEQAFEALNSVGRPTDEQAQAKIDEWLNDHPEATTTVQDGAITSAKLSDDLAIGKIDSYVSPMEFGAVGDGVADDTDAFAAAESSQKSVIYVPKGVYKVTGIVTEKSIIMDPEAWITTDADRANVVTVTGDNQVYRLNFRLKNTYAHAGVIVDGDYNHFEQIIIDGLNYDGVTLYPNNRVNVGVIVLGSHNTFDFVRMYDFVQDYAGNDSAPQGIALDQNANFNSFDNFVIDNCRAGLVNAALPGTVNRFNNISVTGCGDNGVYCVRGGKMEIGTLMHEGTNECLAVITDTYEEGTTTDDELTSVSVGSIFSSGDYDFPLRIKNAGYINIGRFDVAADIQDIIFVNRENVHSAGISIDSLTFRGSCTWAFFLPETRGELEYLNIDSIEILDNHKNSALDMTNSATSSYFLLTMAKSVNIGHANVTIKDAEGVYETAMVRMRIEVKSGVKESSIRNLNLKIISIRGEGSIDIINAKQNGLDIIEGQIQGDSNLIRLYNDDRYKGRLYSRLQPQYGTWKVGDIVISDRDNTLAGGTIGWICVIAGTPGTWKELKMFPFTGATRYDNGNLQYWSGSVGGGSWQNIS